MAQSMTIWFSTFDNNSAQIGVIYTHPKSKLLISQNTFLLGSGEQEYESAAVYVYAQDISSFVDDGGNRGYDRIDNDSRSFSLCNGIYVNNEDECIPFDNASKDVSESDVGLSLESECSNTQGVFRSHLGSLKRCQWLSFGLRREKNCDGLSELGAMCKKSCQECGSKSTSSGYKQNSQNNESESVETEPPTKSPTKNPAKHPTERPTLPMTHGEAKKIVFYVLGDAPYKESEFGQDGFPSQIRDIPDDADFVIHVGDMQSSKSSLCDLSWYQQVAGILKQSSAPVFITPGDNDWLGE